MLEDPTTDNKERFAEFTSALEAGRNMDSRELEAILKRFQLTYEGPDNGITNKDE